MLSYFGLYSSAWSDRLDKSQTPPRRRWLLGRLPHEIAELNDR